MALNTIFQANNGDRPNVPNIIILMTDGVPNPYDPAALQATVAEARRRNIRIVGVGIGSEVNTTIMESIVTPPASSNYFQLANFDAIAAMLERIVQQACIVCGEPTTPVPPTTPAPCKYCFSLTKGPIPSLKNTEIRPGTKE